MAVRALFGCGVALWAVFAQGAVPDPARSPMDWTSVHPVAIAQWKSAHKAPAGVEVDVAARRVTFLAEAMGVRAGEPIEFFAIGPLSDRAYEAAFVSVAAPKEIAAGLARCGVPCGVPTDFAAARLWPQGEKVAVTVRRAGGDAKAFQSVSACVREKREDDEPAMLARPFVYTGGAREAGVPVADTNMPCAVFALYGHAPSLLQLDDPVDQSAAYGRFSVRETLPKGELWEVSVHWDGTVRTAEHCVCVDATNAPACLKRLRALAADQDVYAQLSFAEDVSLARAADVAKAFAALDGQGLKMNGTAPGQFFFRAYLPNPAWRERTGRLFQPFEIRLAADGGKTFTYCEEDWSGAGLDPVLKPRTTPFTDWSEVPGLIARTGAAGEKITVCFLFAPASTPVAKLLPAAQLAPRVTTFYIFAE